MIYKEREKMESQQCTTRLQKMFPKKKKGY